MSASRRERGIEAPDIGRPNRSLDFPPSQAQGIEPTASYMSSDSKDS